MAKPKKPHNFQVVVIKPRTHIGSRQAFAEKVEKLKYPAKLKLSEEKKA